MAYRLRAKNIHYPVGKDAPAEAKVTVPLGEEWTAEYEIVSQGGVPVIADLHITPETKGQVPAGGLSARLLRSLRLSIPRRLLKEAGEFERKYPMQHREQILSNPLLNAAPPKREYRRGRPNLFYAELAERYVTLWFSGVRKPLQVIAKERKQPAAKVRDMISQARKRGLLTKPPKQGSMGGQLTAQCLALLGRKTTKPAKPMSRRRRK